MRYPEIQKKRSSKRRLRVGRLGTVLISLLVLTCSGFYSVVAISKPLTGAKPVLATIQNANAASVAVSWPQSGQAAIGSVEQGLLASSAEIQEAVPIASIAKAITALAILQKKPFKLGEHGENMTITSSDVEIYNYYVAANGSNVAVQEGEVLTQFQALEAMMLPSANNIADSMAIWAFGSIESYISYAQSMLQSFGLTQSTVNDASGFSPLTKSTPKDLIVIGKKVLENPILRKIVSETEATIPVEGTINNVNKLLGSNNVIGIKTGNTTEAGGCLLIASTVSISAGHEVTMIGAVTGAPDLSDAFHSSMLLIDSARPNFKANIILRSGSNVASYEFPWGSKTSVITKEDLIAYGWSGKSYKPVSSLNTITAPTPKGTVVGNVSIENEASIKTISATTESSLASPSIIWRLSHYFN